MAELELELEPTKMALVQDAQALMGQGPIGQQMQPASVAQQEMDAELQELMQVVLLDDAQRAEVMIKTGISEQYRPYLGVCTVEE